MTGTRQLLRRRRRVSPVQRDIALTTGLFIATLVDAGVHSDGQSLTAVGLVAALIGTAPLVLRSRWPVGTAVVLVIATIPMSATLRPVHVVALPVFFALYTVAATGDRRRSLLAAAGVTLAVLVIVAAFAPAQKRVAIAAQNVGIVLASLALGDAVRWRAAYRAAMKQQVHQAISEERLRIARDVHDSVAHAITAINVQAGAAAHLLERNSDAARAALVQIRRVSGDALDDLRGTLGQLREGEKASMRPAPTIESLDDLAERVRATGVNVTLIFEGTAPRVSAGVEAAAHRIVQEALTNVLRHSGATSVTVRVTVTEADVVVDVSDDGRGPAAAKPPHSAGFGLIGMQERALSVGGSVEASPQPGGGWRVHASLPLTPA